MDKLKKISVFLLAILFLGVYCYSNIGSIEKNNVVIAIKSMFAGENGSTTDFSPSDDDIELDTFEKTFSWPDNAYVSGGRYTYSGVTSDYKYLAIEYTGDISHIRLALNKEVWFSQNSSGTFLTVDGEAVPATGDSTKVVIDLEASGVDPTKFNDFWVHTGNTTAGSVTFSKAWLSKTIPTGADSEEELYKDIELNAQNLAKVYDPNADKGLERTFSWDGGYVYGGHGVYSGITSKYKYLILEYTGDISNLRLNVGRDVWFSENSSGTFLTVDGGVVPSVGDNTLVVIDLEKSGVDPTKFKDFYIHTGNGPAGSLTISKAILSLSPDPIKDIRAEAIKKAEDLKATTTNATIINKIDNIIDELKAATTESELNESLSKLPSIEDIKLQEAKDDAIAEIVNYLDNDSSNSIKAIVDEAKESINNATTISDVESLKNTYSEKIELQEYKESKIPFVEAYNTESASDEIKDLVSTAIDDINAANTKEDVDDIILVLDNDVTLSLAKDEAIAELNNYVGTNYNSRVEKIYKDAVEKIKKATSKDEIDSILSETKKEIAAQLRTQSEENPTTLDNIISFFALLLIGLFGFVISLRCLRKVRKIN